MQPLNAVEAWTLYDSVLIGAGQSSVDAGWYNSFLAAGNANEIPFFNQRNRSQVGAAYNNFDTSQQMSFGFRCFSIGLSFSGFPVGDSIVTDNPAGPNFLNRSLSYNSAIFANELIKHVGVIFKVNQDEKLATTGTACPAGVGLSGSAGQAGAESDPPMITGLLNGVNNGVASVQNRFKFPKGIDIPRTHSISAVLQFSEMGRTILRGMEGPLQVAVQTGSIVPVANVQSACSIQMSLVGMREVQRRNAQHF